MRIGDEGKVVKVLSECKLVINRGSDDGVRESDRFLVYALGDELFDPDTKESLGRLEVVRGEGKPTHIQSRMTTLEPSRTQERGTKTVRRSGPVTWGSLMGGETEEVYTPEREPVPFDDPRAGDFARLVTRG